MMLAQGPERGPDNDQRKRPGNSADIDAQVCASETACGLDGDNNAAGRARLLAHFHRAAFAILFLTATTILAVLSQRHQVAMDWTASSRNTLSAASIELLKNMPERIRVRAFISDNAQLREATRQMLRRYQRAHQRVALEFIDPSREPRETERLGVRNEGELVVEYAGRRENVPGLSETQLSNALSRLARSDTHWAAVLTGRGERELLSKTRDGLGQFSRHLGALGMRIQAVTIGNGQAIAANASVVVVLQPKTPWSDEDFRPLSDWISRGGNVLWLADAGRAPIPALANLIGVTPEPGFLVDPSSQLNGKSTPEFIVVKGYGSHVVTKDLHRFSAFPTATSLAWEAPAGWQFTGLAATGLRAWRETGGLSKALSFDAGEDSVGPLDIALAGARPHPSGRGEQRIVVFGDSDFLSNAYLGLGANRALASAAFHWVSGDDEVLNVPVVMAQDLDYDPNQIARAVIALGAPIILPLALLAFGLLRWRARRQR